MALNITTYLWSSYPFLYSWEADNIPVIAGYNGSSKNVVIPRGVGGIQERAFSLKSLTSVVIPQDVDINRTSFESGFTAFYNRNGRKAGTYTRRSGNSDWRFTPAK